MRITALPHIGSRTRSPGRSSAERASAQATGAAKPEETSSPPPMGTAAWTSSGTSTRRSLSPSRTRTSRSGARTCAFHPREALSAEAMATASRFVETCAKRLPERRQVTLNVSCVAARCSSDSASLEVASRLKSHHCFIAASHSSALAIHCANACSSTADSGGAGLPPFGSMTRLTAEASLCSTTAHNFSADLREENSAGTAAEAKKMRQRSRFTWVAASLSESSQKAKRSNPISLPRVSR
mmetsp:Transcript_89664/g.256911  ORF Transcript_89664/g.256911 Transcript_89664/m.256911 type:complete len:241 (-) Transcript_89664:865-1587(-)